MSQLRYPQRWQLCHRVGLLSLSVALADSEKSQKQLTLSGEQISWGSSDIDDRASSIDDFETKALRTISFF